MLIFLFIYLGNEGLPNVAPLPHTHRGSHETLMFHRRHLEKDWVDVFLLGS